MKIILASDSFKNTLSSLDICNIAKDVIKDYKDIELTTIPIADGGEGSLEAISNILDGKFINLKIHDAFLNEKEGKYFVTKDTAYIELACLCGITTIDHLDVMHTSTYALGEAIKDAIDKGYKNINVFLGGSCSNDGGCGALRALGAIFVDYRGIKYLPEGFSLKYLNKIDLDKPKELLKDINLTILCDVNNVLYGRNGAAYVFGTQKGANNYQKTILDDGLFNYNRAIKRSLNIDVSKIPGMGAAGGTGAGLYLIGGKIESGIKHILEITNFKELLKETDIIITGEGKYDTQTLKGKVVKGIIDINNDNQNKLVIIAGCKEKKAPIDKMVYKFYTTNIFRNNYDEVKKYAKEDYATIFKTCINDLIK